MTPPFITSVYGTATAEYIIKKSRFIASIKEVFTEEEATAFVATISKTYWDARHNCYAWQLGPDGMLQKSSDNGEPSGTAGKPMLEVLKKQGLTNTVVVVTRYFGGIKLGASGLIRAYSHAVALGLEAADIADYIPHDVVAICVSYSFVSTMERFISQEGIRIADRAFADTVTFTVEIPQTQTEAIKESITNMTNGTAIYTDKGTKTIPIIRPK